MKTKASCQLNFLLTDKIAPAERFPFE